MTDDQRAYAALELRIKTVLPDVYQDTYEDVLPTSMGSAGLKYSPGGAVAWDEIWTTFCDLAMAGGPPHKGTLLEPGSPADIAAEPDLYQKVVAEICRGVALVTGLPVQPSPTPGWVRVECPNTHMAAWLLRAITMENVSARAQDKFLDLPAGPAYRLEKEIKNVITVIAKTCHYWVEHMWPAQERAIAALFAEMPDLIEPDASITPVPQPAPLPPSSLHYPGWLGYECPDVHSAIWMMRALVASNILSRREGTVLFVPVNSASERVFQTLGDIHAFAAAHKIL